ncbi:MobA/MobL family protein [Listeria booriae]|uniref:MobA/MobL family protein n=1 Tax=Listeria booriae TaxID=1552123 RepID=A0A7X0XET7_9LIST|nr:MobQ family relaxase [Listeria booriae]MBC1492717.1 MobA/MobL family protein [Listeria booriae]
MAIYHFSMGIISRGKGQSVIAAAAYRSGEKLYSDYYGKTNVYFGREVKPDTLILKPKHAPDWCLDRERLWNEVEKAEKQKNAQLAREFTVALPVELSEEEQKSLITEFCQTNFVDDGMVADICIHRDDQGNPHAHVMLTMRPFELDGSWGAKSKKEFLFLENGEPKLTKSGNKASRKISATGWDDKEKINSWRKNWADAVNQKLEANGFDDRISEKSNEDLGYKKKPTIHEGYEARLMDQKGLISDRVETNKAIRKSNAKIDATVALQEKISEAKEAQSIVRLLSPKEKQALNKLSKELKTFIHFGTLQDKKRMLANWRASTIVKNLGTMPVDVFSKIKDTEKAVKQAEEILMKESERILKKHYPFVNREAISDFQVSELITRTINTNQIFDEAEVSHILDAAAEHEIYHAISHFVNDKYVSHQLFTEKVEKNEQKINQFVATHHIELHEKERIDALPQATQNELRIAISNVYRYSLALQVISHHYTEKIHRVFPEYPVQELTNFEKENVVNAIDYYGDHLTREMLDNMKHTIPMRFTTDEKKVALAYLKSKLATDKMLVNPAILKLLKQPGMEYMFFNECLATDEIRAKAEAILDKRRNHGDRTEKDYYQNQDYRKYTSSHAFLNTIFAPNKVGQFIAALDRAEQDKNIEMQKLLGKKKRRTRR